MQQRVRESAAKARPIAVVTDVVTASVVLVGGKSSAAVEIARMTLPSKLSSVSCESRMPRSTLR